MLPMTGTFRSTMKKTTSTKTTTVMATAAFVPTSLQRSSSSSSLPSSLPSSSSSIFLMKNLPMVKTPTSTTTTRTTTTERRGIVGRGASSLYLQRAVCSSSLMLNRLSCTTSATASNPNKNNPFILYASVDNNNNIPIQQRKFSTKNDDDENDNNDENQKKKNKKKQSNINSPIGGGGGKKLFRADRVLSNRGWGSRSVCSDLLKQKRVFERITKNDDNKKKNKNVNIVINKVKDDDDVHDVHDKNDDIDDDRNDTMMRQINGPSEKIKMDASLWIDGKVEVPLPPPLLRIYHKPKWVLSVMHDNKYGTETDEGGGRGGGKNNNNVERKHLGNIQEIQSYISNMHPVGRLDYDTSGLLLFSSNGVLTQTLLHPNHNIQKEYVATVVGTVDETELRETLQRGVTTSLGTFPATVVSCTSIQSKDDVSDIIQTILKTLPSEYDIDKLDEKGYLFFKNATELSTVRLIVEEGKHRMVRRILANSGYPVIGLKRERLGMIHLHDLKEGSFRDLTEEEEVWATQLIQKKTKKKTKT